MTLSSDFLKEYAAVRTETALFDFSSRGKIQIKGNDRVKFLQGLATNDINRLSDGKGLYTILPSVKGKIASEAVVYFFPGTLFLTVHPELTEKTVQMLNRYKIGSDAKIEDVTERFALFSIQGPKSDLLLRELFQISFSNLQTMIQLLPDRYLSTQLSGLDLKVIHDNWSGETGFDLLVPAGEGAKFREFILNKGKGYGLTPAGEEVYETIRVEAGVPLYGKELSEDVLPQEAGLEARAISYTKGCFIGQETIARLHYLGHTNRSLVGILVASLSAPLILFGARQEKHLPAPNPREAPAKPVASLILFGARQEKHLPAPNPREAPAKPVASLIQDDIPVKNDKIGSGEKILGMVTSALFSPLLKQIIAMGYVSRQFIKPGTVVEIDHRGKKLKATVTELPFIKKAEQK
ncbi:MAG: aminomethyl transferase family protein [Nitrospirae bacterium]|nr:aminomethyl transferase family protein [Nitrospirota bacterium]